MGTDHAVDQDHAVDHGRGRGANKPSYITITQLIINSLQSPSDRLQALDRIDIHSICDLVHLDGTPLIMSERAYLYGSA